MRSLFQNDRSLVIAGSAFIAASLLLSPPSAEVAGSLPAVPAGLEALPEELNLGTLNAQQQSHGAVIIRNSGNRPCELLAVRASCGCTIPQLASHELDPGEETELKVFIRASGQLGQQVKHVLIPYRIQGDRHERELNVSVQFDVRASASVSPVFLSFSDANLKTGEGNDAVVTVKAASNTREPVHPEGANSPLVQTVSIPSRYFQTSIEGSGEECLVHVHFDRERFEGSYPLRAMMTIELSSPDSLPLYVPITAVQTQIRGTEE